ncbi:phosphoribosyltransferase-like protein [Janthinobacterium sp. LB3P118]|uniref:phosphoribosyltransferase-like protein n=1 Tax=Janthinobacterium sp. LB3P118 TaxID=3424195 RepID=UPI003F27B5CD
MQLIKRMAAKEGIVLALVFPKKRFASLEKILDKFAINDWRISDSLFLIEVEDQYVNSLGHAKAAVRRRSHEFGLVDKSDNIRYIVIDDFGSDLKRQITWVKHTEFVSCSTFKHLNDGLLELRLKEWKLDWKSSVVREVNKWQHDALAEKEIEQWLDQFDKISDGRYRWVGERLLRNFKVISSQDMTRSFERNYSENKEFKQICIIRYENGKSADSISVMIRKQLSHLIADNKVLEYREFLESDVVVDSYVFEDGAFTGIEISDFFYSLMGISGYTKCARLTEIGRLNSLVTNVFFSLATDVGIYKIQQAIKKLDISVNVVFDSLIEVLSDSGRANLEAGSLYELDDHGKEVLRFPDLDIVPQAFLDTRWGSRREEAINFCRKVGVQLFRSYQEGKGKAWTERRIHDCALGAGNMALLIAFSHSLPKSTIPFFWCHGKGEDTRGREFSWKPLFASAHSL